MEISQALSWLEGHIDLEKTSAVAGRVRGLSLEPMRALCRSLGDPQHAQPVIHLTGTNGKGSTARIITSLLREQGLVVGTYTSPHIEAINERICRGGEPISDADLAEALSALCRLEGLAELRPSYFELLTAAAFWFFARIPVSVAVVEVGMLGRFDATNVADGAVAVLTNVGRDHTDGAEGWRRQVALEKAGIVKPGATFVLGETRSELADVFAATPAERTWVRGRDFGCERNQLAPGGRAISVRTPYGWNDDLFVPLHGAHQGDNAAIAIASVEAFLGGPIARGALEAGLAAVAGPSRFEVISPAPLVVLDGAHNLDGAAALRATLEEGFGAAGKLRLVLGVLGGRRPEELIEVLGAARAAEVIACAPDSPRAIPAEDLARLVRRAGGRATVAPDVAEALRRGLDASADEDLLLVTGSIYTVGQARSAARAMGLVE